MAKTVSGPPRRPAGRGGGAGSEGPGRAGRGGSARRRGRLPGLAGLFVAARRAGGAGRGRRRPSAKAVLFAVIGGAIVVAMAWALLGSRLLVVRSVQVVGAGRAVPAGQVLAAARVPHGTPLIRLDTGTIAHRVEQLRQVQYAQVSKDWPSTVVITITPRTPVFALRVADGYALVDPFGVSVRDVAGRPAGLPLLSLGGAVTALRGNPSVRAAALVLAELPRRVARQVRSVSATSPEDVSLTLADRSVVVWGSSARGKVKAKELTVLMHKHARSYDVSGTGTVMVSG